MNNQLILQQGYMNQGDILDVSALRPFINKKGEAVVHNGERERVVHNALLRQYEWETIDAAVLDVMRQPIVGIADLIAAGLTRPLGGLGTLTSTYEQLKDMDDAEVTMNITAQNANKDKVGFEPQSIPVPIISKPFEIDIRMLEASRKMGETLDVTMTRVATIKVRDALETILFNGSSLVVGTMSIYGYTTAPHIDTKTAAVYGGGDFGTDTNGHKTLVGMMAALVAKGFNGPFGVYVSTTQYSQLQALTGTNKSETQLSVILRTLGTAQGGTLQFVKRGPKLADGKTVMVQLTSEVVDLAVGQDVAAISWAEFGGMLTQFRVLTAAVPRIKFDSNNACGVAVATAC
jgi:uncharacterized linocin/CFP29 family protein